MVKGMGGAMDLVAGVRRIIVLMDHVSRDGTPKFRKSCTLPLTGSAVVDMLITDLAVFSRPDRAAGFRLVECAPGVELDQLRALTEAESDRKSVVSGKRVSERVTLGGPRLIKKKTCNTNKT